MVFRSSTPIKGNLLKECAENGKRHDTHSKEPDSESELGIKTPREAQGSFTEASTQGRRD